MHVKIVNIHEPLILFKKPVAIFLAKQSDLVDISLFGRPQENISVQQHIALVLGFPGRLSNISFRWISDVQLSHESVGQRS